MELTADDLRALLKMDIKRVKYDGRGERPYEAIVCAMQMAVAKGNRAFSATMTKETLTEIRHNPGGPRIETRPDGKFNMWTPFHLLEVECTAEKKNHCRLYDQLDRIVAEVQLGDIDDAEPSTHGKME